MDYKTKYLKYKQKYLTLKKQLGGTIQKCSFIFHDETFFFDVDINESPLTFKRL